MTPDERDEYEERAAIMQHHGGMTRDQAERAYFVATSADRSGHPRDPRFRAAVDLLAELDLEDPTA